MATTGPVGAREPDGAADVAPASAAAPPSSPGAAGDGASNGINAAPAAAGAVQASTARLCVACSAEATADDTYCEACGALLPEVGEPTEPASPGPAAAPGTSTPPPAVAARPGPAQAAAPAADAGGRPAAGAQQGAATEAGAPAPDATADSEPTVSLHSTGRAAPASQSSTVSLETPSPAGEPPAPAGRPGSCPACASEQVDDDGYCLDCGLWVGSRRPGDHVEVDLGRIAGVSDRGLVHHSNEDAMGLRLVPWPDPAVAGGTGTAAVAVVCDGVSTVPGSGPAAAVAAETATSVLVEWLAAARVDEPGIPGGLRTATDRARRAMPTIAPGDPAPSCTFAAAVVTGSDITVGWLGDSRVYLIGADGGALQLTADDTLSAEAVRAGIIPPEAADTAPGAHTITRWLSPDRDPGRPRVAVVPITWPGRVVVCTDGLWNYASGVAELAAHVAALPPDAPALAVARHLTTVALRAGGRDNITVVVIDMPGRG